MIEQAGQDSCCRATHRILTREELSKLDAHPLTEIGAHTVTHPLLAAQTPEQQFSEIVDSRAYLADALDRPVTSFSYPYGGKHHYSPDSVRFAWEAGYSRACTTEPCAIRPQHSPYEWGRLNVTDMDGAAFEKFLAGVA